MCCVGLSSPTPVLSKFPCYRSVSEGKRKKRDVNEKTNRLNDGGDGPYPDGALGGTQTNGTHPDPDDTNSGESQSGGPQTGMYSAARLR